MNWRLLNTAVVKFTLLAILYILISATALGVNPFRGQTVTPFDLLVSQPAWSSIAPATTPRNGQRSDILDALLPRWINAKHQLQQGQLPLWNDKPTGGDAGLLVLTEDLLVPAFWIFAVTPNSALGFYLAILFNLSVAGLGMHLFLRKWLHTTAALMGGVTFALCGFNTAWLYWPHVLTIIWCPWLLLAIAWCAERPTARNSIAIAVFTAFLILGGFPFVTALALEAGGLLAIVLFSMSWREDRIRCLRFFGWYGLGSLLGILLCAIPLLALSHWIKRYPIGYRRGGSSLTWHDWTLLLPTRAWSNDAVESTMYVGFACVILVIVGVVASTAIRRLRQKPLFLFGVCLCIIAVGLAFGLWPMWLIGWMPGMSFNPWSRAICILDISLITLAACALDQLWHTGRSGWWRILRVVVIAILLVQIGEIGFFFRKFNGPVPSLYFYPKTAAIGYMQDHSGPFDYVVADKSFLVSGTLGAYGLREWFAHGFRTEALTNQMKLMASDPFTTRTASRLKPKELHLRSPAFDALNVRYLAVNANTPLFSLGPNIPNSTGKAALPPMPRHTWKQFFHVNNNTTLTGISIKLATYHQTNLPGRVFLSLVNSEGTPLGSASVVASSVTDNAMRAFNFKHPLSLAPGKYAFSLVYNTPRMDTRITAWAWSARSPRGGLVIDGKHVNKTLKYRLAIEPLHESDWKTAFVSPDTTIWENSRSPNGAYFMSNIQDVPNKHSSDLVKILRYSPDSFALTYSGTRPGYIVAPMMWTPDWDVRVNNRLKKPSLVRGVMPAVRVTGPAIVRFDYHPQALQWLWWWIAAVVLTGGIMAGYSRLERKLIVPIL